MPDHSVAGLEPDEDAGPVQSGANLDPDRAGVSDLVDSEAFCSSNPELVGDLNRTDFLCLVGRRIDAVAEQISTEFSQIQSKAVKARGTAGPPQEIRVTSVAA